MARFPLGEHCRQPLRLQAMKVDAGNGRGYASDYGNFGDGIVGTIFDIHSLMVDEAFYVT
jgi:hypothetical protein